MHRRRRASLAGANLLAALAIGILSGCAATYQAPARTTGFLDSYDDLHAGEEGEAWLLYVNPDARFARYDKIMIDVVTIRRSEEGLTDMPGEELHSLVNYLDRELRETLGKDYEIVEHSGAGVMRLRVALTEARGSKVVLDTVSVALPQMRLISNVRKLSGGAHAFVGSAGIEGELIDSLTGQRLMAAVDRRAGGKRLRGVASTWSDVEQAFDYWAERMRTRLAQERAR